MAAGMTPEEFWHGPPELCKAYREAWRIRRDNQFSAEWRQGIYVLHAVSTALDKGFNGGKAKVEYPDAPLFSSKKIREEIEERRERKAIEAQKKRLDLWAAKVNKRFAERDRQRGEGD